MSVTWVIKAEGQKLSGFVFFVQLKGLEPPRLAAPDPKSGVAANYTTAAKRLQR